MEILIITGPPYSGKGTQCELLESSLAFKHISTGDRCRQEKENETELGITMAAYQEKGDLVPDSIMKGLFSQILDENLEQKGIILDGYPRTEPQVNDLLDLVAEKSLRIGKVLNIDVPKEELLVRAKKRAETSTRPDDKDPATHLKRINVFENSTRPGIAFMKTKLEVIDFDGMGSIAEITERIKERL